MRSLTRGGFVEIGKDERATLAVPLFRSWIRKTQGRIAKT